MGFPTSSRAEEYASFCSCHSGERMAFHSAMTTCFDVSLRQFEDKCLERAQDLVPKELQRWNIMLNFAPAADPFRAKSLGIVPERKCGSYKRIISLNKSLWLLNSLHGRKSVLCWYPTRGVGVDQPLESLHLASWQ